MLAWCYLRDPVLPTLKKLQKLMKISEKCKNNWVGNTAFATEEFSDSSVLSVRSVVIVEIDWLSGTIGGIGGVPDTFSVTDSKVSIGYPMTSATDRKGRIELYHHRLWSVIECPRLSYFNKVPHHIFHNFTSEEHVWFGAWLASIDAHKGVWQRAPKRVFKKLIC